ncbi:MAG TPA: flagellar protein FlgN [Steroidobacteraceae bacterium]|nr:flagellar protein FlgN [Steroidobacteraceae bacterium]
MSPQRTAIQPALQRILSEESAGLNELEGLLARETHILQGEDVTAIQHIGSERHRCVERLTRLDAERGDLCRMLSFGSGLTAIEKLLGWADPQGQLQAQWQSNLQVASRCREINDRNGAIVAVKLGRVQKRLALLRGSPLPPVYSPRPARHTALAARDLGQA